mgnify:CR=1 FL=1
MSRTRKDRKKLKAFLSKNGPASFKKEERARRRAQAKEALKKGEEPDRTYIYSEYYW